MFKMRDQKEEKGSKYSGLLSINSRQHAEEKQKAREKEVEVRGQ